MEANSNFLALMLRGIHRLAEAVESDPSLDDEYKERFVEVMNKLSNEDQNIIYCMIGAISHYFRYDNIEKEVES